MESVISSIIALERTGDMNARSEVTMMPVLISSISKRAFFASLSEEDMDEEYSIFPFEG